MNQGAAEKEAALYFYQIHQTSASMTYMYFPMKF